MTLLAFVFIFFSIFLHAAWNLMSKGVKPSMAFYAIMGLIAALVWLPFFFLSDWRLADMPWQFFAFLGLSVFGEFIYMLGLAKAYRMADISYVYPVVRALPVLMVATVTIVFKLGKTPSALALTGMLVIMVGCLIMPMQHFRDFGLKRYWNRTILFILLATVGTTCYTIADSSALSWLRKTVADAGAIDTFAYLFLIEGGLFLTEIIYVACSKVERALFCKMFGRTIYPVLAGFSGTLAYALVLFAMKHVDNVSYIQAFRQMSLPVGFFAGVLFLKERASRPKLAGLVLIVAGLVMVALFS